MGESNTGGLRVIVSPAKKMRSVDVEPLPTRRPELIDRTRLLLEAMKNLTRDEAQRLWKCSDRLCDQNYGRLASLSLDDATTSAVVSYEGIQYQHLAASVMDDGCLAWIDRHLRIVSGFYGILRPFDGVVPYRLEMQAKLSVGAHRDLYGVWGDALYQVLAREGCELVVNLASVEYAKAVVPHARKNGLSVLTCLFGVVRERDGAFLQRATEAKAARGTFVRWCAERDVTSPDELASFSERDYRLDEHRSTEDTLVFVKA